MNQDPPPLPPESDPLPPPPESPYSAPESEPLDVTSREEVFQMVNGPAVGLMLVAGSGVIVRLCLEVLNFMGLSGLSNMSQMDGGAEFINMFSGAASLVGLFFNIALYGFLFFSATKMRKLENWGLSLAGAIAAMVPCHICCVLGLPIGIWALVILFKPEVQAAFR